MPNRILREGILDSREVNALPEAAEILYRRLMSVVDDYGRYEADPELIRARCFARQLDRWPLSRVSEALSDVSRVLSNDGQTPALIKIYEVNGKTYLEINKFQQRTRSDSKFPPSIDGHMTVTCQTHGRSRATSPTTSPSPKHVSDSENARAEFLPARKVVQAVRLADASERFMEFWEQYPLKTGMDLCAGVWLGLVTVSDETALFACLSRYLASDHVARGVVKAPNNWLHDCARDKWASDWPAAAKANGKAVMPGYEGLSQVEADKKYFREEQEKRDAKRLGKTG